MFGLERGRFGSPLATHHRCVFNDSTKGIGLAKGPKLRLEVPEDIRVEMDGTRSADLPEARSQ
ncbi:hypothetical protein ABID37_001255 [Aquamicrobium terrae]|uniref:AbrB/MazE/SpoVT family DNA-binding domain-containing protein n=1 Tax=Aquamicrobium terrae TaxID=1324945 RepID=A0ABV2MYT1_9HYPH